MNVTCDNGGSYNAYSHLNDLASQDWDGNTKGLDTLFHSVGADVGSENRYYADLAHDSPTTLGHYLGSEDNYDVNKTISTQNPEFARILVDAVHPYLGSYAGVDGYGGMPEYGVEKLSADELEKVFSTLGADPEAAAKLNTEAARWQNAMAYAYGQDPESTYLAYAAGFLEQSQGDGNQTAIDNYTSEQKAVYDSKSLVYSTAKDMAGLFPVVGDATWLAQQPLSDALLGPEPTTESTSDDWNRAVTPTEATPHDESSAPLPLLFSTVGGYVEANPTNSSQFDMYKTDGHLDWDKVKANEPNFYEEAKKISVAWPSVYGEGSREANSASIPGTK